MKTQSVKTFSVRMVLFAILLCGLSVQTVYAYADHEEKIDLDGNWEFIEVRSLVSIPSASFDGQFICIANPSQNCDITVTLVDGTGEEVYRQTFSRSQTACIVIPTAGLSAGTYTLQITNDRGGYLTGTFSH